MQKTEFAERTQGPICAATKLRNPTSVALYFGTNGGNAKKGLSSQGGHKAQCVRSRRHGNPLHSRGTPSARFIDAHTGTSAKSSIRRELNAESEVAERTYGPICAATGP